MSEQNIALIYFSGTQVTETYSQVIQKTLTQMGKFVQLFNITSFEARQKPLPLENFQAAIFGFPVYSDFAPRVINTWISSLDGKGKPCAQFFTYGGRTSGYAHFHTMKLLQKAGFQVLLSAEFLGRHTFNVGGWQILSDRPNESDFIVARGYAAKAYDRFFAKPVFDFKLQKPFGYHQAFKAHQEQPKRNKRGLTNPIRVTDQCSMCRDCETECPTQSFNADSGLSDPVNCIECMHCLYICPDEVIEIDKRMKDVYSNFLATWHLTETMMQNKQSKIISESWEAAS